MIFNKSHGSLVMIRTRTPIFYFLTVTVWGRDLGGDGIVQEGKGREDRTGEDKRGEEAVAHPIKSPREESEHQPGSVTSLDSHSHSSVSFSIK